MRLLNNKITTELAVLYKSSFVLMFIFAFYFILVASTIDAQTRRPTPTPRQDIPTVVSRDDDTVRNNTIDDDVRETTDDSENTINLPRERVSQPSDDNDDGSIKQKKMVLYLDLLTKVEQRSASLQEQLYDLLEKQNTLTSKIKQLEYQLRPEVISSTTGLTGSLRPEDLREQRKLALELEKSNFEALLQQLDNRRSMLEENVRKADVLVEKIRLRFDQIVEAALNEDAELF